jgi:hypothetical protein
MFNRFGAVFLVFAPLSSTASDLIKSQDEKLAHILTTMEVLYESTKLPYVEVIQSWEEIAECGGSYQSCPNARLFIATSLGDLYESPMLYELPKAKGWEFVRVEESEHQISVTLKTTLMHANVTQESRKLWSSKIYVINISKHSGIAILED